MVSVSDWMVTGSVRTDVFVMVTLYVTSSPGSGTDGGVADLLTVRRGAVGVTVTVADAPVAMTLPSSSRAVAVTVSGGCCRRSR